MSEKNKDILTANRSRNESSDQDIKTGSSNANTRNTLPEKLPIAPIYHSLGFSTLGHPMGYWTVGEGAKSIVLMGGLHGDEYEGVILLNSCLRAIIQLPNLINNLIHEWKIVFLPLSNPDGFILKQRWNSNLVDLNRNFPSSDWQPIPLNLRYPPGSSPASEKETQNIIELIKKTNGLERVIERIKILPELNNEAVEYGYRLLVSSGRMSAADYLRQISGTPIMFETSAVQEGYRHLLFIGIRMIIYFLKNIFLGEDHGP